MMPSRFVDNCYSAATASLDHDPGRSNRASPSTVWNCFNFAGAPGETTGGIAQAHAGPGLRDGVLTDFPIATHLHFAEAGETRQHQNPRARQRHRIWRIDDLNFVEVRHEAARPRRIARKDGTCDVG